MGGQHCYDRNLDLALIPLKIFQAGLSHAPSYLTIQLPPACLVIHQHTLQGAVQLELLRQEFCVLML